MTVATDASYTTQWDLTRARAGRWNVVPAARSSAAATHDSGDQGHSNWSHADGGSS